MKLGILSDLHIDFTDYRFNMKKDVHYINAGDIAHSHVLREYFNNNHPGIMTISGNHDYYGNTGLDWQDAYNHVFEWNIDNIKIRGASLWTDMKNDYEFYEYFHALNDANNISNMTYESYKLVHEGHKDWLFNSDADVLVMHHAPSWKSIHEKYKGDSSNKFFVNDFDDIIMNMKKSPKIIVHGHVHNPHDYMIGDTRVICHPRGYPGENDYYKTYQPKIVEI